MIEAICFDMDGILFDTERLSVESWIAVAEKLGLGNIEKGVYGCIGLNRTDCRIFLKEVYGEDFPYDYFREQTSALFQERVEKEGLPVMKGAGELLTWLQEKGVKIALASSTGREKVLSHLRRADFTDFFQVVIGGDMVEHSKPAPDIFLKACAELGVAPERAYAIEDSYNGIRAAHAGHLLPIMVPDLLPANEEMQEKAEVVLPDLFEVIAYLKGEGAC